MSSVLLRVLVKAALLRGRRRLLFLEEWCRGRHYELPGVPLPPTSSLALLGILVSQKGK